MAHLDTPAYDTGHFTTLSVRPRSSDDAASRGLTSRTISFPKGNYAQAPNIAGGFAMLDLAVRVPSYSSSRSPSPASSTSSVSEDAASQNANKTSSLIREKKLKLLPIRANIVGSHITPTSFRIGLETWAGGIMNSASATWIEHKFGAKDCQFGQFDTMDVLPIWRKRLALKNSKQAKQIRKRKRHIAKHEDLHEENEVPKSPETESSISGVFSTFSPISMSTSKSSTSSVSSSPSTPSDDEDMDSSDESEAEDNLPITYHHTIHFSRSYESPPTVVTWLNRIDISPTPSHTSSTTKWLPFRLSSNCTNTSTKTTTLIVTSTSQSKPKQEDAATLNGAAICYIAFPPTKPLVASGQISVTSSTRIRSSLTGRVRFPQNRFKDRMPTVLAGLSGFECPGDVTNLRVGVEVTWVTNDSFGWEILGPETHNDDHIPIKGGKWKVEVSWIALGFV